MSFGSVMSKVGGGFASALSPVGGMLNGITGVTESQDRTYEQQRKAMKEQNAYNTYMWNLANQYNTPAAQLARMAEAGIDINPTSYALGTGNLSNTAGVVSSASGFSGSGSPAGNPITMAMGVANGIQGIKESKARTALDEANTDNMNSTRLNTEERTRQMKNDNDFFEKNGYYPAHAEQPVLSGYVNGPVGKAVKEIPSVTERELKNPTPKTVVKYPLVGPFAYGISALRGAWKKFRK